MSEPFVYDSFRHAVLSGSMDLVADDIRVMLVTAAYVPDRQNHRCRGDVVGEVSAPGYAPGGESLEGKVLTPPDEAGRQEFSADDVAWDGSEIFAAGAVVYRGGRGSEQRDELISYHPYPRERLSDGGRFLHKWLDGVVLYLE